MQTSTRSVDQNKASNVMNDERIQAVEAFYD
ncbi:MAG: hypothetical protein RLZZ613_222, partial [Pseudomonadota bacterium]